MVVLSMPGRHLGDVVMAMPAVEHMLAAGEDVGILIDKGYLDLWKSHPVKHVSRFSTKHKWLRHCNTSGEHLTDMWCRQLGIKPKRIAVPYEINPYAHLMDVGRWFVLAPWVEGDLKVWTPEGYAACADYAASLGYIIAMTGPTAGRELADSIKSLVKSDLLDLVGKDTRFDWPHLLSKADIVLAPDTGTAHVADAVGAKTVALFGWVHDPATFAPYWSRHLHVRSSKIGMKYINIDDVKHKIRLASEE